jgi:RNA polymerase sigma-70 factor (ECF subfamily)
MDLLQAQAQHDEIIEKAQNGDHAAFEQLYLLYKKKVHGVCFTIVKNDADAEDLTQDTFINAFRYIKDFRRDSKFSTWLTRIAINAALMHLRKRKNKPCDSIDELIESQNSSFKRQIAVVDHHQASTLDRLSFMKAFKRLRKKQQFLLYVFDIQGCEQGEIAAMLGVTDSTLKSRIHRARLELRSRLGIDDAGPARPHLSL